MDNSWFVSLVIQEKWFDYFAGIYVGLVIKLPVSFGHSLSKIGTSIPGTLHKHMPINLSDEKPYT